MMMFSFLRLKRTHNPTKQLAHSWGGIVLSSALGRFPAYANEGRVASQVWFGSKRVITVRSLEKLLKVRRGIERKRCVAL